MNQAELRRLFTPQEAEVLLAILENPQARPGDFTYEAIAEAYAELDSSDVTARFKQLITSLKDNKDVVLDTSQGAAK